MGVSHSKTFLTDPSSVATAVDAASDGEPSKWRTYDYIIVGGGTAGCVLASRLSENPKHSVLVVEAGKTHQGEFMSTVPAGFSELLQTKIDWNDTTVPQSKLSGRTVRFARGKVIGGTSTINCLINTRCSPDDFDQWSKHGASGWGYKDLLPYFIKSETFTPASNSSVDKSVHGTEGPWKVQHPRVAPAPIHDIIMKTFNAAEVQTKKDTSTRDGMIGCCEFLTCTDSQAKRSSAATAYLSPEVLARSNLTILTQTRVEKIIMHDLCAVGVQIASAPDATKYRAHAAREVILCAGAIATPQILLCSGIGPIVELESLGVDVKLDLPKVGKHLNDHVSGGTLTVPVKTPLNLTIDYLQSPFAGLMALARYIITGGGPLAGMPAPGAAFIRVDSPVFSRFDIDNSDIQVNSPGSENPEIEILWIPALVLDLGTTKPPKGVNGMTFNISALNPSSEGTVSLKSASVWDAPLIDPNYLSSENDVAIIVRATRLLLHLLQTEPLKSVIETSYLEEKMPWIFPGNKLPDDITDKELREWVLKNALSGWHPACTARMGASTKESVVDPDCRVHGIRSLRIVDASIFPKQVSGHPCAVVIAMAEKAADLIKKSSSV